MLFACRYCLTIVMLFCLCAAPALAADEPLPPAQQEGGMGLFEALKKRASAAGGDFSAAAVSRQELSNVLWAATGLNRAKGWTVPMWRGAPPYCRIYVAGTEGVFLYDWATHSLKEISKENIKAKIGDQAFVKKAAYSLLFVLDGEGLAAINKEGKAQEFGYIAVGAMTQNVYLAAAAQKLSARYIHSINREEIARALSLAPADLPVCLMLLGK